MRVLVLLVVIFTGAAQAQTTREGILLTEGYRAIAFDRLITGHQAVRMTVNGQPGLFLIDSGASQTVIDLARARRFNLSEVTRFTPAPAVSAVSGHIDVARHRIGVYQIGPVLGYNAQVFVADLSFVLSAIRDLDGPVVDGIIGQDLLTRHAAILDFGADRLYLLPE